MNKKDVVDRGRLRWRLKKHPNLTAANLSLYGLLVALARLSG